jgi:hypothetical protein
MHVLIYFWLLTWTMYGNLDPKKHFEFFLGEILQLFQQIIENSHPQH